MQNPGNMRRSFHFVGSDTVRFVVLTVAMTVLLTSPQDAFARDLAPQKAAGDSKEKSKTQSETGAKKKKKKPAPFRWVNPIPQKGNFPGLKHGTFRSPSMNIDVGYCIYLPPGYETDSKKKYPVVYYLHGGRPGSEIKSISLTQSIHKAIAAKRVDEMIYVFVNGGAVSHYNYPEKNSLGEDVFVKELIPHVDAMYRTIADRSGRGLEGFSQGGRGTARIMFRYPQLFVSAAPGGGGHATEKRISEEDGRESETLKFLPGHNTYDRARLYASKPNPPLNILVYVGTKGFNYENNLEYMKFLDSLKIPYQRLIVEGVDHNARKIYEKNGLDIMKFHAANFAKER